MKTKEEVIKEAWGEHYNIVKENINKDGWCIDKGHKMFSDHRIYDNDKNFDFVFDGNWDYCEVLKYRPKSLRGIEDNNMWIRIESEADLPEKFTNVYCLNKYGNMFICESRSKHFFCHTNKWLYNYYDFTHYQPIVKPNKPLY